METVILKTGVEVAKPLVGTTMMALNSLMDNGQDITFYELVMKCRDSNHEFFGNAGEELAKLGLLDGSGKVHRSIKDVVLAASEGVGLDMALVNPLKV